MLYIKLTARRLGERRPRHRFRAFSIQRRTRMTMIKSVLTMLVPAITLFLYFSAIAAGQTTQGPLPVTNVRPPDFRPCAFFQLQGVTTADPVAPGSPWFAIPMTNIGFHEQFALLLTASFNPHSVVARTTGKVVCGGFAEVDVIYSTFP
jgi:hypothetical protein